VVILLSDGDPTDNYRQGLEDLWSNKWYSHAIRLALPIGKDVNTDMLAEFTGSKEGVLKPVTTAAELRKMLKAVSITSTSFATRSSVDTDDASGPVTKLDTIYDDLQRIQDEPDDGVDASQIVPEEDDW
jgi:uncharacterized protein YegL